jgi:hypothetical protein
MDSSFRPARASYRSFGGWSANDEKDYTMKRALIAFVCAFALSAPAYAAGLGLTFNNTNTITGGAGGSIGNAVQAWHSTAMAQAATDTGPGGVEHTATLTGTTSEAAGASAGNGFSAAITGANANAVGGALALP